MLKDLTPLIPVLSLAVAALAVFFGPLISMIVANRKSRHDLRVANKQIIAPIRQSWINELRILLADITGKCAHYWAAGYEDRSDSEYLHITEAISRLNLYLNLNEEDHLQLLEHIKEMEAAISSGSSLENDARFWAAHRSTISQSQLILKREWERVKNEI
ncbi:hypothetical protein [Pseudoalteromonas aurantia]|uniref:DUF2489 domain-containing protein n=1 Tax=Pseudoalteromonas aurantia 208 TaxID=1314867 RepID=A0ABR9ECG6_9GAMM|nr:hypothetical protein [Pseudoalteromonas aurantia]MBE0368684.1 hypothetical protein [Pseudoalteromonas aurantia 208]